MHAGIKPIVIGIGSDYKDVLELDRLAVKEADSSDNLFLTSSTAELMDPKLVEKTAVAVNEHLSRGREENISFTK